MIRKGRKTHDTPWKPFISNKKNIPFHGWYIWPRNWVRTHSSTPPSNFQLWVRYADRAHALFSSQKSPPLSSWISQRRATFILSSAFFFPSYLWKNNLRPTVWSTTKCFFSKEGKCRQIASRHIVIGWRKAQTPVKSVSNPRPFTHESVL